MNFDGYDEKGEHPGKIDNSELIVKFHQDKVSDDWLSTVLIERKETNKYMNHQLRRGLKEGDDFMLVD